MPKQFYRSERVSGQLRRELAQLIQREIKDPGVGFISVSDVEVTRDLAHAKVFITVFEADKARDTMKALQKAAGFLRRRLGHELRMRNIPELHFLHDASVETGQKMDQLIATAVASDNKLGEDGEPEVAGQPEDSMDTKTPDSGT